MRTAKSETSVQMRSPAFWSETNTGFVRGANYIGTTNATVKTKMRIILFRRWENRVEWQQIGRIGQGEGWLHARPRELRGAKNSAVVGPLKVFFAAKRIIDRGGFYGVIAALCNGKSERRAGEARGGGTFVSGAETHLWGTLSVSRRNRECPSLTL